MNHWGPRQMVDNYVQMQLGTKRRQRHVRSFIYNWFIEKQLVQMKQTKHLKPVHQPPCLTQEFGGLQSGHQRLRAFGALACGPGGVAVGAGVAFFHILFSQKQSSCTLVPKFGISPLETAEEERCADLVGYTSSIAACAVGRCLADLGAMVSSII